MSTAHDFKPGDRVALNDAGLAAWGDQSRGTTGTVRDDHDPSDGWVSVRWDHGGIACENVYRPNQLDLLRRPSKAPESARYVVRPLSEVRDEDHMHPLHRADMAQRPGQQWVGRIKCDNIDFKTRAVWALDFARDGYTHAIVDTQPKPQPALGTPLPAGSPRPRSEPTRPSDERICEVWEAAMHKAEDDITWAMRHRADGDAASEAIAMSHVPQSLDVDGMEIPRDEYIDIRSAVLAARVAASEERDRRSIACEGDLPCELVGHDVAVKP